jgi:hypothetical protein
MFTDKKREERNYDRIILMTESLEEKKKTWE